MKPVRKTICPDCRVENIHSEAAILIHCNHCDCSYTYSGNRVQKVGEISTPSKNNSPLSIGMTGTLEGISFTILGHIRYRYSSDFWDEWFAITANGQVLWIVESEQKISLVQYDEIHNLHVEYEKLLINHSIEICGEHFLIINRGVAVLDSFEGEIPFDIAIDRTFQFVFCETNRAISMLELCDGAIARYRHQPISLQDLAIHKR